MDDAGSLSNDSAAAHPRYAVQLLHEVEADERGLRHRGGIVEWDRVERAYAADVGEPEGVRTIVFDLVVEIAGPECVAYRFDAEPGEQAVELARRIEKRVPAGSCSGSVRALAKDGLSSRWYPDLESFECANLAELARG